MNAHFEIKSENDIINRTFNLSTYFGIFLNLLKRHFKNYKIRTKSLNIAVINLIKLFSNMVHKACLMLMHALSSKGGGGG